MGDVGSEGTDARGQADTVQQRQVAFAQRTAAVQVNWLPMPRW
jgi:hypothetical protein